ncbi:MAG: phospholipase, partial [Bacteroidota bacterium]|nr:phospholipase [Bacteroidota bacterium]
MKNQITSFLLCLFLTPVIALAQHHGAFKKYWYVQEGDTLPYRLLLPAKYDSTEKYPLIIFLHGSGERGDNNTSQLNHGGSVFTNDSIMENYPAIVVFPQCRNRSTWANM